MSTGSHQSSDFSSMSKSIPELITFLRHALTEAHFDEVENILVEREETAKREIEKLRTENEVLRKKCEVLNLAFGGGFSGKSDDQKREKSAEEIYDQLVGEMVRRKGKKESDEVGRLKREIDELKRKNVKIGKFVLDCVENYVEWRNKFSSLQQEISKIKAVEVVGLVGISKDRSGENGENRESFLKNDDGRLLCGNICRMLDFDVDENDPVFVAPAKDKHAEAQVDQVSWIVPEKRAVEIIDVDDDLPRALYEGNMAFQKPLDGEHSNQSNASKGKKRKGYSCIDVADLEKDPNSTNGIDRLDIQTDRGHVNKGEKSTQKFTSPLKVSSSAASTPGVSGAEKVAASSQHNAVALRHCEGKNVKKRHMSEQLKISVSKIAQMYGSGDSSGSHLSAEHPKKRIQWKYRADMVADLSIDDRVCLSAVCALYRQQKSACEDNKGSIHLGFSHTRLERGIQLAKFLIDGDPESRLRKTEKELQSKFTSGLEDCRVIAREHLKQLFEIYQKKLDAFYPDA